MLLGSKPPFLFLDLGRPRFVPAAAAGCNQSGRGYA
jgi:hypothetical protein